MNSNLFLIYFLTRAGWKFCAWVRAHDAAEARKKIRSAPDFDILCRISEETKVRNLEWERPAIGIDLLATDDRSQIGHFIG
jgi:hypothetical protein